MVHLNVFILFFLFFLFFLPPKCRLLLQVSRRLLLVQRERVYFNLFIVHVEYKIDENSTSN